MTQFDERYDRYNFPTTSLNTASGHPGYTNAEQDAAVATLRSQLESEGYTERIDTITLLRFLRARKFDLALAKQMFVECEQWRKSFGVDDLLKDFVYVEKPKVAEYYPQYYHKTDKDGRPIYIEQLGKIDLTAMYKITTQERMLQNLVYEYEKLADPRFPACSRKAEKLIETCCTIMDLKGVGITSIKSVYTFVNSVSAISQNYYPERLGKLYIINAPWGFSGAFSLIKSFLDPVTVEKIHILGSGYKSTLLEQVPAENLPVDFGGSCSCEGGCGFSDAGPWKEPQYLAPAFLPAPTQSAAVAVPAPTALEVEVPKEPVPTPTTTAPLPEANQAPNPGPPVALNKIDEKLEAAAEEQPAAPVPAAAPAA